MGDRILGLGGVDRQAPTELSQRFLFSRKITDYKSLFPVDPKLSLDFLIVAFAFYLYFSNMKMQVVAREMIHHSWAE